jgi:adenylate cyclase
MKKKKTNLWIAIAAGVVVMLLWAAGLFKGADNKFLDFCFRLRGPIAPCTDIAIVVVDEESIKELGRWPWPRSVHARLVKQLAAAGAKAIVFDVLFIEPDKDRPAADKELGAAIRASGRTVLGAFYQKITPEGVPLDLALPIAAIRGAAPVGFVNVYTEMDGINRSVPLLLRDENAQLPSLALAGLAQFMGKTPEQIMAEQRVPLDEFNEMMVNYAGGFQTFAYYSFTRVLRGEAAPETFKDKIVLVGGTATALFDFKATPFAPMFPGVEIHANTMANILQKNYLRQWPGWLTLALMAGFALFSGMVTVRFSPLNGGLMALALFAAFLGASFLLFIGNNLAPAFVPPAASLLFSYAGVVFHRFMTEEREKRWIKKTFSHYLSAHVMASILEDPGRLRLGGQRETLTVLFSDIRGFTTISEALNPEEVVELLNEYLGKMVEIVFKYDGTLDKFIGDAVMAFWGAPVPQKDHPRRAVLCAIDMIEELKKLQDKWRAEGKKIIDIGIGVNTGEMVVGNMGSKEKMEYTIIGDNVNLGSRLEGLNKEYKTHIIISDATYQAVSDIVDAKPLGAVKVKGKEKSVEIYEVIGKKAS